jgi:hypothetical protein
MLGDSHADVRTQSSSSLTLRYIEMQSNPTAAKTARTIMVGFCMDDRERVALGAGKRSAVEQRFPPSKHCPLLEPPRLNASALLAFSYCSVQR